MPIKRARRPIAKTPETTPQANVALSSQDATKGKGAPKLPHERDESPATPLKPGATMAQAERDLAHGQTDTDRYTDAARTFERGRAKKTR